MVLYTLTFVLYAFLPAFTQPKDLVGKRVIVNSIYVFLSLS